MIFLHAIPARQVIDLPHGHCLSPMDRLLNKMLIYPKELTLFVYWLNYLQANLIDNHSQQTSVAKPQHFTQKILKMTLSVINSYA